MERNLTRSFRSVSITSDVQQIIKCPNRAVSKSTDAKIASIVEPILGMKIRVSTKARIVNQLCGELSWEVCREDAITLSILIPGLNATAPLWLCRHFLDID
jgi:hypothetical protein